MSRRTKGNSLGLDTVETVMWAEKEFGVSVPDVEAAPIRTVGEFAELLHRKIVARDRDAALSEAQVFATLKAYLVNTFDIPRERVLPNAEFVRDLGLQ
jgi:acyl carrier protein